MNDCPESSEPLLQRRLAALPTEARPPLDWPQMAAILERRRTQSVAVGPAAAAGRRVLGSRGAAAVSGAGVALLMLVALVLRGEQPFAASDAGARVAAIPAASGDATLQTRADQHERALVFAGPLAASHALEDSIAFVDEVLTEERVRGAPRERLYALEARRSQLMGSLQQVQLAQRLMYE